MKTLALILCLGLAALLAACDGQRAGDPAGMPPPQAITDQSTGHYCGMNLYEHTGPKGQIILRGREDAVWFSTIREVFAYTILPEEPKTIAAIYVQDMGQAGPDGNPVADSWIDARKAHYLIDSEVTGGMGAPDALPFADIEEARQFALRHGGRIVSFDEMPEDYVMRRDGPASTPEPAGGPA